jgi:ABC-type glycerol-3-phosphate transport system substrate-binding protein
MYIYQIINYYYNEEMKDNIYGFAYVVHDEKYSYEEFSEMCKEAKEKLGNKDIFSNDIGEYLIKNYGFKDIPIENNFEYDVDEE